MFGWHHLLNGLELVQVLGVGDIDREAWYAAVHGTVKSQIQWSD